MFQILLSVIFAFSSGRPLWLWQTILISGVQSVARCISHSVFNSNISDKPPSMWATKQKLYVFWRVKTLCYVFIVCRAVTIWLSLVLVANKVTYYLPNPLKHLIWHIIISEIIFTTYVNVFSCLIKVSLGGCILHHWNTISFLLLLPVCLIKDTIISEVTFIVSMKLIRHFKLQLNRIKIGTWPWHKSSVVFRISF